MARRKPDRNFLEYETVDATGKRRLFRLGEGFCAVVIAVVLATKTWVPAEHAGDLLRWLERWMLAWLR